MFVAMIQLFMITPIKMSRQERLRVRVKKETVGRRGRMKNRNLLPES